MGVMPGPSPARDQPLAGDQPHRSVVLEAVLERVTYANEDTGYTIAGVATERTGPDLLAVVGPLLGAQIGQSLRLTGHWGSHPRYGRQFVVESYTTVLPATIQGIRRYLGSGLIKGIGPTMAERMVDHFGLDILTVIETEPQRLVEVHGLGPKRTRRIAEAWEEQKAIKEVMVFLSGVGVSTSLAVRIYKKYTDTSIDVVRTQPYLLASEVWGIGFKTADTIAQAVGIPHDSPDRIKAGLQYTLSQAGDNGHCYLPEPNLITDATKILEVDRELVGPCLDDLVKDEGVVRESVPAEAGDVVVPAIYLVPFHRAEASLTSGLLALLHARTDRLAAFQEVDWDKALAWLRTPTGQDLAPEQQEAVTLALTRRVAVLTGDPGCGKSFTVRSVVELARAKNASVVLVAPTGRAAKRLAELTGHEASTVHRLLKLQPGGDPKFDRDNPLDADLVVVDESSMMDLRSVCVFGGSSGAIPGSVLRRRIRNGRTRRDRAAVASGSRCRSIGTAVWRVKASIGPSSPGVVQSRIAHRSISRFSTGVPVSAIRACAGIARNLRAVWECGFFACWASSATTRPHSTAASSSASRNTTP
jgi:exodeoxyribonuclease V alpha subunit